MKVGSARFQSGSIAPSLLVTSLKHRSSRPAVVSTTAVAGLPRMLRWRMEVRPAALTQGSQQDLQIVEQ